MKAYLVAGTGEKFQDRLQTVINRLINEKYYPTIQPMNPVVDLSGDIVFSAIVIGTQMLE